MPYQKPVQKALLPTDSGNLNRSFSLFEPEPVSGTLYITEFIAPSEETDLLAHIDAQPWCKDVKRWTQHYGAHYLNDSAEAAGILPDWLSYFAERLYKAGHFPRPPNRAGVNHYMPGQGIGQHKDKPPGPVETVAILSLNAALMFDFTRLGYETQSYYLQPRSLLLFGGEARHKWMHGIVGRMSDRVGGLVIPRQRRVSVTFRLGPAG